MITQNMGFEYFGKIKEFENNRGFRTGAANTLSGEGKSVDLRALSRVRVFIQKGSVAGVCGTFFKIKRRIGYD
ncbi:hypothetical protein Amal_01997 [Acetobacter malorum]|uniref:Uncharacterized protein n=1 Tax=Acetobacter malorum TaxID=178901 RepID=A0A177GA25_9PROT|nr:hypothetical protein [Acetobacter malorum]OAG76225.1 hypothetical protein Amal_01997 [Acetobacter malorum]